MEIKLYKNYSPKNVAEPNIELVQTVEVNIKESHDILSPSFTLSTDYDFNYVEIPNFNRFYFAEKTRLNATEYRVTCKVNPLHSWITELKGMSFTIARNTNMKNGYLVDSDYKSLAYNNIFTRKFPNEIKNDSLVLMVID